MKKVTVNLPQGDWGTVKTKYPKDSDQVKFNEFTGSSKNFDTDQTGAITKSLGATNYNASLLTGAAADMYEAIFNDGTHHLLVMDAGTLKYSAGGGIINTVTAGYSAIGNMEFAMYQNRAYFGNGIDNPQSYDLTTSYGGVSYVAPKTKQMGCLVPSAPSAALVADATANQIPAGAHTYKVTYLYYGSEESNGSASASSVVTADGTHTQVTVTIPVGGYGVTARKIYRDNNDGNYLLVGTQSDNTATTYTDKAATGTTTIPVDNGLPPTFSLILQWRDRLWAAGVSASASTLYYSDAGLPDIFHGTGYILCNPRDPIVGLVVFQDRIIVFNRHSIGQILGVDSATFAYSEIPSSVGCVDNRSIQLRTVNGITTILWLSDKGVYEFDGNAFNYVSDPIEDQVNFNIQQAAQVKGKNAQDTQADFTAGTSTPGIVLSSSGFITQNNPKRTFQVEADYAGGTPTSVALRGTGNIMKAVLANTFALASGAFNTAQQSGSNIILPTSTDYTGVDHSGASTVRYSNGGAATEIAQRVTVTRAGTLNNVSILWNAHGNGPGTIFIKVYANNSGVPGSVLYTGPSHNGATGNSPVTISDSSLGLSLTAGQTVWISLTGMGSQGGDGTSNTNPGAQCSRDGGSAGDVLFNTGSGWTTPFAGGVTVLPTEMVMAFTFTSSALSASGTWTSAVYDTQSDSAAPTSFVQSGTYPAFTGATSFLEGSNDQSNWDVSTSIVNTNGTTSESLSSRRYWRARVNLTSSDDRNTPTVGTPSIAFPTTATWVSPAIDHTTDITALGTLTFTSTVPGGTSLSVQIATSDDNSSYTSYGAIGSAVVKRYSKIKVTFTTDGSDLTTPTVNNIQLTWTVVSTQTSSAIDTSNTPVGWELFQSTFAGTGTVAFWVRTATTSGGLSGASWVSVTNGAFITAAVNRWIQWKTQLTSTADNVASVDSVTINWFIKQVNSIRVASLFYNRAYYLSAAEFGQTTNNIGFKLEQSNKWRVRRGENLSSLSFFFNEPYACLSTSGQLVKWLTGTTFAGANISLDLQTAAINYDDMEHSKVLRKVYVQGLNTGATYTPQYSVDNGLTWKSMVNPDTGLTTFVTTSDGGLFTKRLVPNFASDNATGRTHIFRLLNSDAFACEIHAMKLEAWIRQGEPVNV